MSKHGGPCEEGAVTEASLDGRCAAWRSTLAAIAPDLGQDSAPRATGMRLAQEAMTAGRPDLAAETLRALLWIAPEAAEAWQLLGFALREEQRVAEALAAFARASELRPADADSVLRHAHACSEAGLPAADLFRRALALAPENLRALRGFGLALAAEGKAADAQRLFLDVLARLPDWLEGHRCLAALRFTSGERDGFAGSYAEACRVQPNNLALRMAWFRAVAQTRDWDATRAILEQGEERFGPVQPLVVARIFVAAESGDRAVADALFRQTDGMRDTVRDMAYLRHCLRTGRPEQAAPVAERLLDTPSRPAIWAYLSLIWRLLGDRRAEWLDGAPPFIRALDLGFSAEERAQLAVALRRLHTARAPYLEQSVRGGTQTDGQLFFRQDPIIQTARTRIEAGVRQYVAGLPERVPGHPLLDAPRAERILFSGSWSVRLQAGGYNVSHTHPLGWISSAFYVELPPPAQLGLAPSGWIRFGEPPPELGLNVSAYAEVEPRPGRLVLFPSTMWHRTVPFDAGERLVIAFDVRMPRS
jgi:tetratricopeptide (TPR) repeat protein